MKMTIFSRPLVVASLVSLYLTAPSAAQKKKPSGRWELMDYGPFLSASITAPTPKQNTSNKGVAIHLSPADSYCFDTDLLRWAAAWTGEFLSLEGTPYDGGHGSHPKTKGQVLFGTTAVPGWTMPGTNDLKDPRREAFGPLPKEWARFKGLYRNGDKVVLSYAVGDSAVLEYGEALRLDDLPVFTRTVSIGPGSKSLSLLLWQSDNAKGEVKDNVATLGPTVAALINSPAGARFEAVDNQIRLHLPAREKPVLFRVVLANPGKDEEGKFRKALGSVDIVDPATYTRGGPALWSEAIETKGVIGKDDNAYVVDTITVPEQNPYHSWMRFGGFDFFSDGRAALCTWSGDVWIVSGIDDKLEHLKWKRFASGLFQPLGLKIVDDKVYTLGREGIVRLHDLNNDGEADFYEYFNNDVHTTTGFHEFAFDLQTDQEGNFYFAKAGPVRGGGRGFEYIAEHSGCILKVDKYGEKLEVYASGLRAPNGIGVGPHGEVTSGDNEGTWMPMCRINLARPGGFLGCKDTYHGATKPDMYDPPICWLPKNVDNSNGGQVWVTSDRWGPFKDQLLHTSYGTSSLYKVLLENDADTIQGGVVRIPVNFMTGIMRPRFSPLDGQLYVTGLKGWQSNAARDGAFQRVRYTGKAVNLPTSLKVVRNGLDIVFTDPLDPKSIDAENFSVKQWNYLWCSEYGSDNYSAKDPEYFNKMIAYNRLREEAGKNKGAIAELAKEFKKGADSVKVEKVTLGADGKTVHLEIANLHPVMQMNIKYRIKTSGGNILQQEIFNTINRVPQ